MQHRKYFDVQQCRPWLYKVTKTLIKKRQRAERHNLYTVSWEQSSLMNGIVYFDSVANDVENVRLFHAEAGPLRRR
jgi:hypothetical protein